MAYTWCGHANELVNCVVNGLGLHSSDFVLVVAGESEHPKPIYDIPRHVLLETVSDPSLQSSLKSDKSENIVSKSTSRHDRQDVMYKNMMMSHSEEEPLIQPVQHYIFEESGYDDKLPKLVDEPKKEDGTIYISK